MKRQRIYRMLAGSILSVICMLLPVCAAIAADFEESHDGTMCHYEWSKVCIYAKDVEYTQTEVLRYMEDGVLEDKVVKDCQAEVRRAPEYKLQNQGIVSANVTSVVGSENVEGYPITLYTEDGEEHNYIRIKLFVLPSPKETLAQIQKPENMGESKLQKKNTTHKKQYLIEMILLGTSIMILSVEGIVVIPKIRILRWHEKKRREGVA